MIFSVYRVKSKDTHSALFCLRQNRAHVNLDQGFQPRYPESIVNLM